METKTGIGALLPGLLTVRLLGLAAWLCAVAMLGHLY